MYICCTISDQRETENYILVNWTLCSKEYFWYIWKIYLLVFSELRSSLLNSTKEKVFFFQNSGRVCLFCSVNLKKNKNGTENTKNIILFENEKLCFRKIFIASMLIKCILYMLIYKKKFWVLEFTSSRKLIYCILIRNSFLRYY